MAGHTACSSSISEKHAELVLELGDSGWESEQFADTRRKRLVVGLVGFGVMMTFVVLLLVSGMSLDAPLSSHGSDRVLMMIRRELRLSQ